jgi:hypothetical protein
VTALEASEIVVQLTVDLSATRNERDGYRLVARQALHYANRLQGELDALQERYDRLLEESRGLRRQLLEDTERRAA